jgi:hypothetical protein
MSFPYKYEFTFGNQEPLLIESEEPLDEFEFETVNGRLEIIGFSISGDKPKIVNTRSNLPKLSPSQIARLEEMFPIDVRGKNISIGFIK